MYVKIRMKGKCSSIFVRGPRKFSIFGEKERTRSDMRSCDSNSPSGAILDAGKAMQEKNFSNTFGERLLKIFFDRVGRETKASK